MIHIDYPSETYQNRLVHINGWYVVKKENCHVNIYVDNILVDPVTTKLRPDVYNVYSEYKEYMQNQNSGYDAIFDATELKDGNHTLKIDLVDDNNSNNITSKTKTFQLRKYSGMIYLDYPKISNVNSDITVAGWEMSELDNSYLKLFVDNEEKSYNIERVERMDVINAIEGYGGLAMNANPGFTAIIPINDLTQGKHIITLKLYSKLNELITTYEKEILVYTNRYNGIDVSSHNRIHDWNQVKLSGVDYVIARAAVRGYGINSQGIEGNLLADTTFKDNVNKATLHGMKVGAYVYSQAITELEGVKEVELMIQQVEAVGGKNKVTLPLVIDTEFSSCEGRCGRADSLSREKRTKIVKIMAETIKSRGYTPMIYASTNFLNNQLDMNELSEYKVWVAHYGVSFPTYQGPFEIWQYTSTGNINGIIGNVDMNYFYIKY